ncbi:MAG: fatty acid-binding protein DegV [Chloroflexi bacterium]|nr:fatty acid-binding protein DegV [Chloroflexota bacterium]|tara:strand:- start:19549 stop:20388 length:840 start_codon:yes stop_codon:yes gene_type:complete
MPIKIVTDSTSDIPEDLANSLGITVVPLTVFFGEEAYKDKIEIHHDEFFDRLQNGGILPRTTQPSVGDFIDAYKPLVEEGHEILSIHISEKVSGTLNSARLACEEFPNAKIEILDSKLASLGLALVVKAAAEVANSGANMETVLKVANDVASRVDLFFVLNTLEYLQKGGRIGKAQALVGSLLSVKPILKCVDGEVHPYEKLRTRQKAVQRLQDIASESSPYEEVAFIYQAHGEETDRLTAFLEPLSENPLIRGRIGPVIGTYTGPNVVGIALLNKQKI